MDLEHRILDLLAALDPPVPKRFLAQAADLLGSGESVVAIENLCRNIYEEDAQLAPQQLAAIADVAAELGLSDDKWRFIHQLEQPS